MNYKRLIYIVVTIIIAFLPLRAKAQTPNEKNKISQTYNQIYLTQLQKILYQKSIQEKQYALEQAKIKRWQISIEQPDGGFSELIKVVNKKPIYYTTFNADAAISTRANFLHNGGGLGLNLEGQNMEAHIWDGGLARSTHQEYDGPGGNNRFSIGDGTSTLHYHSAHVTGTIIASGVHQQAKGMAPQAYAVGYEWNNDTAEATTAAANGMLVSNHSYGYVASSIPDQWFGAYQSDAHDWDDIMYNAPYYLMMVAAGNDGNDNSSNGNPLDGNSSYDKLSGHATAKNNLVVANALDANIDGNGNLISVNINSGSSEGPTDDYRIKPDIAGNGTALYSTYESSDNDYNTISGTSMASPNVTGSLLLLQQHYNIMNGGFMRAATLKGLALHTADDAGLVGPDAVFGWGLLNTKKAAETITQDGNESLIDELLLNQGASYSIDVESDGINPLIASISWTDPAGVVNTATNDPTPALVNDLDIRITQDATTYFPYRLTSITTNDAGDNSVDPFERVNITGASGTYTITINHKGTLSSTQAFSLIVTGITYTGECTATIPTNVQASIIETTSATIIWDYVLGADYELRYREVGAPTWTTILVNSNSYTISNLTELTQYEVQVRSLCVDASNSEYSPVITFTTNMCSYCTSSGNMTYDTSTTLVSFNTINNSSAKPSGYSDYTVQSTDVFLNQAYDLSIRVNTDGNYIVGTKVWIDWNQDCDFNDIGEEYTLGSAQNVTNGQTSNSPLQITVPINAVLGNTIMRVSTKYYAYPTSCETDFDGEVEDYAISVHACTGSTTTWDGTNWNNGVPTITMPVIINGNYNTNNGSIDCCTLTINNGISLTVNAGQYVNVKRDIINYGTLVVQHEGSLAQSDEGVKNSGAGTFIIHKTTRPYTEYDYTYWSSPVVGETIGNVFNTHSTVMVPNGEPSNGDNHSLMSNIFWLNTNKFNDDNNDTFDDELDDWTHAPSSEEMPRGRGYIAMGAGSDWPFDTNFAVGLEQSVYFESNRVNNAAFIYSLKRDNSLTDSFNNENLIGNPYASAIDLELLRNDPANSIDGEPVISPTVRFWSHDTQITTGGGPWAYNFTNSDYATYGIVNGTAAKAHPGDVNSPTPSKFLASCQSAVFEATIKGTKARLHFNNSMRVKDQNDNFFKSKIEADRIWLNMSTTDGLYRQIAIVFLEGADDTINDYDSKRMLLNDEADFYSLVINNEERLVIQGLSPFTDDKIVPLGMEILTLGEYAINIDQVEGIFETKQDIYIKDYLTNTLHNLSQQGKYMFTISDTELGVINQRFELCFSANTTGTGEELINRINVYPNPSQSIFNISWNRQTNANLNVYDLTGKLVLTKRTNENINKYQLNLSGYSKGIYFVKIEIDGNQVVKKLVLR